MGHTNKNSIQPTANSKQKSRKWRHSLVQSSLQNKIFRHRFKKDSYNTYKKLFSIIKTIKVPQTNPQRKRKKKNFFAIKLACLVYILIIKTF